MNNFTNKLKASFWIFIDVTTCFLICLMIGIGIICLLPLVIVFGMLFVIWVLIELLFLWIRNKCEDPDENDQMI